MRQYTTPEQTAKLIELGCEKPKSRVDGEMEEILKVIAPLGEFEIPINRSCPAYSIGELIEMLPKHIHLDGLCLDLHIYANQHLVVVKYSGLFCEKFYRSCSKEFADALYDMIVKLKEEGVL